MIIEMTLQKWIITLAIVNIPIYILAGWIIFTTWSNFFECFGLSWTPDYKIQFNRDLMVDVFWVKMKMGLLIVCCIGTVFAEFKYMKKHDLLKDKISIFASEKEADRTEESKER